MIYFLLLNNDFRENVWTDWLWILRQVYVMLMSNPITAFFFGSFIITIISNLIYRLSTPKEGE